MTEAEGRNLEDYLENSLASLRREFIAEGRTNYANDLKMAVGQLRKREKQVAELKAKLYPNGDGRSA